jgi:hypothetical protein
VTNPAPDFASPEDFAQVLAAIPARLHAKNRIALGESVFAWQVAGTLTRLGRVFAEGLDDPVVHTLFGDGYTKGTLDEPGRAAWLAARLFPSLPPADRRAGSA